MSKFPTTVVFDLGKVLLDFNFAIAARALAPKSSVAENGLRVLLDQSPLLHRYEHGEMTSMEFYEHFRAKADYSGTFDEFAEAFGDIFTPIPELIDLSLKLRAASVPSFIFSNTNEIAIGHIRHKYPFFANFDGYILSYEHGAMKPSPRLYDVVEQATGRSGSDLLYLDDRPENIQVARQRGWQTIHVCTPAQTLADFADVIPAGSFSKSGT